MPMKAWLMLCLLEHPEGLTANELYELTCPVYGRERQCSLTEIDGLLMGMLAVGIAEAAALAEKDGELIVTYCLTEESVDSMEPVLHRLKQRDINGVKPEQG